MKDLIGVTLMLVALVLLDLTMIAGILWKGQANFPELIKHLTS